MQDAKHRGDTPADVVPDDEIGPARPVRGPAPPGDAARADTRPPGAPGEPPPMPHRVGGYTVLEPLGTGGMGHVYLARQESLDRLVALKVLRNELASDKGYLERFQREAKAAALFQHPHVVAVIDTGHDPRADLHYIAFEFVDGGSLEGIVRAQGALPERRALEVTRAVALALQFAEARRLIHRDLKPANILIGSDGSVKLADLGLVRQAERVGPQVTQEGIILGTPLYMAPEQALGRDIDIRADIYALGLCLYRMLTGRTPFNERDDTCSTLAILSRHVNEELPDVRASAPDASEGVVRLLADMTAREAERRYRSAVHVVTDIDRVLAGQPPLGARAQQVDLESEAPTTAVNAVTVAALREQTAPPAPGPQDAPTVAGPPAPPPPKPAPPGAAVAQPVAQPVAKAPRPRWRLAALVAVAGVAALIPAHAPPPAPAGPGSPGVAAVTPAPVVDPPPSPTTPPEPVDARPTEPSPVAPAVPDELEPPVHDLPTGELPPDDLPLDELDPLPLDEPAPPRPTDAMTDAIAAAVAAARGDPDRIAVLVRQVSLELFVDVPRGREHLELLVARSGWQPSPLRDAFVSAMQALLLALENVPWDERQRRLEALAQATRARMRATEIERLKAAIDAELVRWHAFALGVPRVRLALGDPRAEEQALRALDALPAECFVREDARALLAMARAADQPDRWVRLPERRDEVRLAVRELRERIERTSLTMLLAEEATVVARVLERQLGDRHASLPTALLRTWAEGTLTVAGEPRAVAQSVFLQARRREVPAGAPWTRLPGWALAVELDGPIEAGGVTVTIDDKLTVHLGVAGVVVGGTFRPCQLAGARQVIVEPRFDGLLLRMAGGTPEELMIPLPEGPVVPVRFTARAADTKVARLVLVSLPPRQGQDPRAVRGESIRRQRQGR